MDIMYLLVPISIFLVFLIGFIFWWALSNRQFDALDEAGARILQDIEIADVPSHKTTTDHGQQAKSGNPSTTSSHR
jgi:cbb3-type cytochrome oxidase maturation protein